PRDLTVIISGSEVRGTFAGFVSNAVDGPSSWTVGPGSHNCRGKKFSPKEAVGDSTVIALAGQPAGSLDAIALYSQPGRYGLTVVEGYLTSNRFDARIVKDAHEEDDYCDAPGAQVTEALPFQATLTIDNPHDVDWIKFHLPAAQPVRIRTAALPAVAVQDSSDIDVYLLHDNGAGNPPDSLGAGGDRPALRRTAPPMTNGVLECFRCHTPIPENSRFCLSCGADVSGGDGPTSTSSSDVVQERLRRVLEGKYRIERLLGKGGMGAVFLAHDLKLEREVAIKVLPPDVAQDDQLVRRFQQEAKTAAKLDHPNIIPIYRVESEGGLNYFVMKSISG